MKQMVIRKSTFYVEVKKLDNPDIFGNTLVLVQYDEYNVIQDKTNFGLVDDDEDF